MLETLRRGAAGWVAKILLGLLIFSFAIWGVADVFRGWGQGAVAKVGETEISLDDFQRAYQNEIEQLRRQFGNRFTAEQARAFGLDQQVLNRMVGGAAIDAHAGELGLAISPEKIGDLIRADPMFVGVDGRFSRLAFDSLVRQNGLTEQAYVSIRQKEEVREQLTDTMLSSIVAPKPLVDLLIAYREETRTVSHFTVDAERLTVGEPDEAKLQATWEQNRRQLVEPEVRRISVLRLLADDVRKSLPISDADIAATYEREKATYEIPERRRVQQISFPDRAKAEAARAAIAAGRSFEDAAKDAGASPSDIDIGLRARRELLDPTIAEAAFALPKDKVSDLVQGQFATVLLRVTEIEPGRVKPLEEVRGEIRDRLAGEKASAEVQRIHDLVEDQRAGGQSLKDIAASLKLPFVEVPEIDRSGKTRDGKPALEGPDTARIATSAFDSQVGAESEAVELEDGGYAWIDVLAVTAERERPLAEVKDRVRELWVEAERRRLASEFAAKLVERADAGEPLEKLAAEAGGKVEVAKDFKRFGALTNFPENAVTLAFATPLGKAAAAEASGGKTRIVFRVDAVNEPAAPAKEEADRLAAEVARQMQGDVIAAYVATLQQRYGVTVNQQAVRRATGADVQ